MEIRCEECGLIFEKQTKNQRYCCEECSKLGNNRKSRERYRMQKAAAKGKEKQTIADINRKAREAGMTYGQYMAKEYGKMVKVERSKEK